ncbi:MAG: YjfB family protein [Oscillospiraceae bacterium]
MDIAAMSIGLNQSKLMQSVSLAMTKKVMDMQQQQGQQLVETMAKAAVPPSDRIIDVRA